MERSLGEDPISMNEAFLALATLRRLYSELLVVTLLKISIIEYDRNGIALSTSGDNFLTVAFIVLGSCRGGTASANRFLFSGT